MDLNSKPSSPLTPDEIAAMGDRAIAVQIAMGDALKTETAAYKAEREKWAKERAEFEKRKDIAKTLEAAEKVAADVIAASNEVREHAETAAAATQAREDTVKQRELDASARAEALNAREADVAKIEKRSADDLAQQQRALNEQKEALAKVEQTVVDRVAALDAREAKVAEREQALDEQLSAIRKVKA